jgi:hypothetical protein
MKTLGPCDIDLSRLNPTPHAIAVYASSPLSPVATQHSLPSGRYPLLGPDFHRPDRTSLRLAHSFDHLVGAREQGLRHGEPQRLGGLEIDDELEFGGPHDRQVAGFLTAQNAVDVRSLPPIHLDDIRDRRRLSHLVSRKKDYLSRLREPCNEPQEW